jgi:FdhE protein
MFRNSDAYRNVTAYSKDESENLEEKLKSGFAVLDPDRIKVDRELSGALFLELCGIFVRFKTLSDAQAGKLTEMYESGRLDVGDLILNIVGQNSSYFETLAEDLSVSITVPVYIAEHLAKPLLARCSEEFDSAQEVTGGESRTTCPLCGNEPIMGMLSDEREGKRLLHCSLCHTRWDYPRVVCAFCRHEEQEKMHFLHYEGDDVYRVNICEACKRYLKVVDERSCGGRTPVLWVEALMTANLDEMALKKGYLRTREIE